MADNMYFAGKESQETSRILIGKAEAWVNNLNSNGYLDKLKSAWKAYYGAYYTTASDGHKITFSGEQGELVNLPVNHLRNLAQHILVMTTATRPSMEARATNTDYKSLTQTMLANGLLDYYMREKRLEKILKTAVEMAIVLGSGFIRMEWNATSGEMYEYNEETSSPVYEGDIQFTNLSPFDVVMDGNNEGQEHDWMLPRTWKNKYDLAAKYPEYADKIIGLPSKSDIENYKGFNSGLFQETDLVAVYEFYHRRSEAMPDGRYMLFVSEDIVLYDGPLPYRTIPIFRIAPSDILGTPYGYTTVFDLLPMQQAINSLYSTILTNQNAFGVQNVLVPRGSDIAISQLAGGLNIIEANIQNGMEPKALNLTSTPAEVFKFTDMLKSEMEVISGVNSVARGQPEASLKSGTALALVQSMAIQFMSGLAASYVALIEDVGTALIVTLRDFAAVPRVAAIVGRANRSYMKEFKGDDLSNVNRVIVDVGNPLARTTAGRVEMAKDLLQMKAIKNVNQYFTVINTGKLEVMNEGDVAELMLIKGENEKMLDGTASPVLDLDDHKEHIIEHKAILADPDLRQNPELTKMVLDHIQQHIEALRTADPDLLGLLGQQPLAPPTPPGLPPSAGAPQPPPPPGGAPGGPQPPTQTPDPTAPPPNPMPPEPGPTQPPVGNLPNMPSPPPTGP